METENTANKRAAHQRLINDNRLELREYKEDEISQYKLVQHFVRDVVHKKIQCFDVFASSIYVLSDRRKVFIT